MDNRRSVGPLNGEQCKSDRLIELFGGANVLILKKTYSSVRYQEFHFLMPRILRYIKKSG